MEFTRNTELKNRSVLLRKTVFAIVMTIPLSISTKAFEFNNTLRVQSHNIEITRNSKDLTNEIFVESINKELKRLPICNGKLKEGIYFGQRLILTVKNMDKEIYSETAKKTFFIENSIDITLYDSRFGISIGARSYFAFKSKNGLLLVPNDVLDREDPIKDTVFLRTTKDTK